jgi:hypothetical protein
MPNRAGTVVAIEHFATSVPFTASVKSALFSISPSPPRR